MVRRGSLAARAARALGPIVVCGALGCVGIVAPVFPDDVASSLAAHPMRRIETNDMVVYFPEGRRALAERFLDRVEGCAAYEKALARIHGRVADDKLRVVLPEVPFNNAFSAARLLGFDAITVVPTFNTVDVFTVEGGLPPDPPVIGCHEITHAIHAQQIGGFAKFWNVVFGPLYTPQLGLDPWFHEGLAVYYETRLQPGVGRLSWPYWHGVFAASVAGRRLNGGDLSAYNRDFFSGNHYVVGSEFIGFLVRRYGEQKLWDLIETEGRSIFFPLGVNFRFWQVYDKTLSDLIDEFADDVAAGIPVVARPPEQRRLREVGAVARYARAPDGTEAFVVEDRDRPSRLVVLAPDGRVRAEHLLTDVLPPRRLKLSSPRVTGALSFTADGRALYFVALDLDATYQAMRLVRYDVAADALEIVHPDVAGPSGAISPDGSRYVYARAAGDHHDVVALDLRDGAVRTLVSLVPGAYAGAPRVSPDGSKVAATIYDGRRFRIGVFDARTGSALPSPPAGDGPVHEPAWVDDHRLVYVAAAADDARFQVYLHDLSDRSTVKVTHAPYLAFEPQATGAGTVRFLNRDGGGWTLDEVALPAPRAADATSGAARVALIGAAPAGHGQELALAQALASSGAEATPVAPGPSVVAVPPATAPVLAFGHVPVSASPREPSSSGATPLFAFGHALAPLVPPPPARAPVAALESPEPSAPAAPAPEAPVQPLPFADGPPPPPPVSAGKPPPDVLATDRPVSVLDDVFIPRLLGPTFETIGRRGALIGVVLAGNDVLYKHRWTLSGYYQTESQRGSVSAGYLNRQLAPFAFELQAAQFAVNDVPPTVPGMKAPTDLTLYRRERRAFFDVQRSFYGNPVGLGVTLDESYRPGDPDVAFYPLQRFAGPFAFAVYEAVESTPYTSARRLLAASAYAAAFPAAWTSAPSGFADLRLSAALVTPLPLSRRHTLSLRLRARGLAGLPDSNPLLQVGGAPAGVAWQRSNRAETTVELPPLSPSQMAFAEGLRGFEDHPRATNRIFIADATYTYPFIVDWGTASTLGLLPALFFSELDLRLFATGASTGDAGDRHLAAGGSLTASLFLWVLPVSVTYQAARRLTDDRGVVQLVLVGL